jgi:hypothetical protein
LSSSLVASKAEQVFSIRLLSLISCWWCVCFLLSFLPLHHYTHFLSLPSVVVCRRPESDFNSFTHNSTLPSLSYDHREPIQGNFTIARRLPFVSSSLHSSSSHFLKSIFLACILIISFFSFPFFSPSSR